ncbi:hypothetical protein HAX54_051116, partial [Datura stramonium]|nr:hypothetical protein [Datura stramonium]
LLRVARLNAPDLMYEVPLDAPRYARVARLDAPKLMCVLSLADALLPAVTPGFAALVLAPRARPCAAWPEQCP